MKPNASFLGPWSVLVFALIFLPCPAQYLVNLEWDQEIAHPNLNPDLSGKINDSGGFTIIGNTSRNGLSSKAFTAKYSPEGTLLWSQQHNQLAGSADYAVETAIDGQGNTIVIGATFHPSRQDFDMSVFKYGAGGNLSWSRVINGAGNGDDFPADLALDFQGNIYVTGTSLGTGTQKDFMVVKLAPNGSVLWSRSYDRLANGDVVTGIEIAPGGRIYVAGKSESSQNSISTWVIEVDPQSGNLNNSFVSSNANLVLESPSDFKISKSGILGISGTVSAGNMDHGFIYLLDQNLQLQGSNRNAGGMGGNGFYALAPCQNGSWAVTGYVESGSNYPEMLTLSYNDNAIIQWVETQKGGENINGKGWGRSIECDKEDNIIVSGFSEDAGQFAILSLMYNPSGRKEWIVSYPLPQAISPETEIGLKVSEEQEVYINSLSPGQNTNQYLALKYHYRRIESEIELDASGQPHHIANEVVVRFDPKVVKVGAVDNQDKLFGAYSDFLKPHAVSSLEQA